MEKISSHLQPSPQLPEMMTAKEVSKYLSIPLPTVHYLARTGKLPGALLIGEKWRFKRSLLDRNLNAQTQPLDVTLKIKDKVLRATSRHEIFDKRKDLPRLNIRHVPSWLPSNPDVIITDRALKSFWRRRFGNRVITIVDNSASISKARSNLRSGCISTFVTRQQLQDYPHILRELLALLS